MTTEETKYTAQDIFCILGHALILLHDKQITVSETDAHDNDHGVRMRVSLVDYIARAVAEELVEYNGETEESVKKAIDNTKMDFGEISYPDKTKCIGIDKDIW